MLDLVSRFPTARLLVLIDPSGQHWPADLEVGLPGSACFSALDLGAHHGTGPDPLTNTTVYLIDCP